MPFTLLERRLDGQIIEHAVQSPLLLQAQLNSTYILIDSNSDKVPDDMVLKRKGDRLEILIEEQLIATIDGFYVDNAGMIFISEGGFDNSLSMVSSDDNENVKDGVVWSASEAQTATVEEDSNIGGWALLGAGVIGAGYSINNNDSDDNINNANDTDYTITVNAAAGPVTSVLTVELYDKDGNLIASESHDFSTGAFVYTVTDGYSGPLFVKLIDSNTVNDYLDEASNSAVNLGEPLRAMVMADGSNNVLLTITPLTELSVRQAGVDEANLAVSEADVAMNDKVGALFNVKDITSDVTTILDAGFDDSDGLSDAEYYGQVLAVLSGVDSTTGSIDATLVKLEVNLTTNDNDDLVIKPEGAELLSEGATVIKSSTDLDLVDTKIDDDKVIPTAPIFNVIAGDNIINGAEQESDITGIAEAGTEITLNLNSVVRTITTDSDGHWEYQLSVEDITAIGEGEVNLTVSATDMAGNTSTTTTQTLYIDTTSPIITSDAIASALDENSGAGQVVYTATSTNSNDITSGATVYSLKAGDDAALLSINSTTGVVVLTANPDDEIKADYSFTVVASDSAGNSSEQAITLDINDLDEVAPTITSAAIASALDENSGAGQVVYTATSTDSGDIAIGATVYSLKVGADAALFTINSSTGAVTLTANPDDETKADYNFTVLATDAAGNSSEQKVTLDITDLDDAAPTITSGASASTINENSGAGQAVYTVTSTDTGDITTGATTYSLKAGNDASFFTINSSTGVVSLTANPNAEAKADYNFTVVATDAAGNSDERAVKLDINDIDEIPPTITLVSIPDAAMNVGDVVTVTLTVGDDGGDSYTNVSGTVGGFVLSNLTRTNSTTYTAQFTIANGGTDVPAGTDIPVTLTIDDSSSNTSAPYNTAISQGNDDIDATAPLVTDANISLSGATGTGGVFKVGDTVTATWNNTAGGDNNTGVVSVAVDFSEFGGGPAVAASNSSETWTATLLITEDGGGSIDASGLNVTVSASDATSTDRGTDSTDAALDNDSPTVTDANISISGASGTGGAYQVGDTVLATWNNTTGGDNNSDTINTVTIDFSQFGGGGAVAASESSGTWTASFTITEDGGGSIDATNRNVSVTATGDVGNVTTTADGTNATVDNDSPTVTDGNISLSGASGTAGAFKVGDTVTATWNNTAGGNNNADIATATVDFSAFGGGAAVAASNFSETWVATYTITEDGGGSFDTTNLNVSLTATDDAGNATTTADTTNATLDNDSLTVSDGNISISGASGTGGAFKVGDTVTATWNNTAGGDNNGDTVSSVAVNFSAFGGGAAVAASNSVGTWTATYLITEDGGGSIDGSNLDVAVSAIDNAGNESTGLYIGGVTVDNDSPTLTSSTPDDNATGISMTDNLVLNFSDNIVLGTGNIVIDDGGQTITIDVASHGGQLSISGNTLTINPTADFANGGSNYNIQIAATAIADDAGNSYAGILDTTTLDFTTIDFIDPVVTDANIAVSGASGIGGAFKVGDTVSVAWNNTAGGDNVGGTNGDINTVTVDFSSFGGGASVAASNSLETWTATFVITEDGGGSIDATNLNVSVTATDFSTNDTTQADTTNSTLDNDSLVVTDGNISISGASGTGGAFKVGDMVTATWNNTAGGDNNGDTINGVTVNFSAFGGGVAVAASNSSETWTATYTITEDGGGSIDGTNLNVSVTATDNVGNGTTTADTSNATVDNDSPTVTDGNISLSGASGTGGAFKVGDTVTATWNNTAGGNNNPYIATATVDFSAFGGGAAVAASNSSETWTATFVITEDGGGSIDNTNLNVSLTATDDAGNTTTTADTTNATLDNDSLTVTDGNISISGASGTGGAFKVGDTVTATWNNTAGGDNNGDTVSGVAVDFSAFGGGATVAASNSSETWTATYTITEDGGGSIDGTNLNVSITATDNAGNDTTTADTTNATLDNDSATVTDGNISISGASGTGGAFKVGDTVTATWNNTAGGDNNGDTISGVTANFSAFGGGAAVVASNSSETWTATYTITEDGGGSIDGTNLNVSMTATDNAGNTTTTADTTNATVDNDSPTLSSSTPSDNATAVGLTADIVLTFNENINLGTGNIVISDGSQTINLDVVTDAAQFSITNNVLTIDPTAPLTNNSANYNVQIDATALVDDAGNPYAGIGDTTTLDFTTEAAVDTSIVVFDLTSGASSSHNGGSGAARSFDTGVAYTIYIKVSTDSVGISVTNQWSGGSNLGSDDTIILVGSGSAPLGVNGNPAANTDVSQSAIVWNNPTLALLSKDGFIGTFRLGGTSSRGADLWTGTWVATPASLLNVAGSVPISLPGGVATSQGV